jgi:hypothetical protein
MIKNVIPARNSILNVSHVTMMPYVSPVCLITSYTKVDVNHARIFPDAWIVMIKDALVARMDTFYRLDNAESAELNLIHALSVMSMDANCAKRGFMWMEIVNALIVEVFLRGAFSVIPKSAAAARKNISKRTTNANYVVKPLITVILA